MQAQPQPTTGSLDDRKATRVDLERKVAFRFENLEGFMTEYLLNLSATGMFIRCQDPQPKGSMLDFEFSLEDGAALIRGHGEVMWARRRDAGPDQPAGMGIRFVHLDAETRELLRWFVTRRYITGGGPCDMEELRREMGRGDGEDRGVFAPLAPPEPASAPAAPEPRRAGRPASPGAGRGYREFGYAAARAERRPTRRLRLAAAVAAAALGGFYALSRIAVPLAAWTPAGAAAAAGPAAAVAEPAASVAEPAGEVPAPAAAAETRPEASPPIAADLDDALAGDRRTRQRQLAEVANAWAGAWSAQDADAYLAFYATDFRPPNGLSRAAWEASRRARITRPRHIEVRLDALGAELVDSKRARVRFEQSYRSDRFRDTVRKTLELVREGDAWRIAAERVD